MRFKSTDVRKDSHAYRQIRAAELDQAAREAKRNATPVPPVLDTPLPDPPGVAAALKSLPSVNHGEDLFALQLRAYRIEYEREFMFSADRRWRFDFALPGHRIGIEVEGGVWKTGGGAHSHPQNIERDIEKYNAAALLGWRVFRFMPDKHVVSGEAIALVRKVIESTEGK